MISKIVLLNKGNDAEGVMDTKDFFQKQNKIIVLNSKILSYHYKSTATATGEGFCHIF